MTHYIWLTFCDVGSTVPACCPDDVTDFEPVTLLGGWAGRVRLGVGLVFGVFLGWDGAVEGAGAGGAGDPNRDVPREPKMDLGEFI